MRKLVNNTAKNVILIFLSLACFFSTNSYAQSSREHIRKSIGEWGSCRNVTITKTNGDLALYGSNGFSHSGLPYGFSQALTELNNANEYIDDVQLTERGRWVILYGNNGIRWSNIPKSLENKLREYNNDREVINSVSFNDAGDWIVITENYLSSSDSRINEWLKEGEYAHGELWAACITDDAVVAVYSRGYSFFGNVPESLITALKDTKLDVYRLKIAGPSWFFADENGSYQYKM